MKAMARLPEGLPPQFRRKIWCSLAENHIKNQRQCDWPSVVQFAFNDKSNPDDDALGVQIVKDLHRTGCEHFGSIADQDALKRVLLAYARWNKRVGYCQGLNILAALILDITSRDEEQALKIMIYLVDHILPDSYFARSLQALSVDMLFVEFLSARYICRTLMKATSADHYYMLMSKLMVDLAEGQVISTEDLVSYIYEIGPIPLPGLKELRERYTFNIAPLVQTHASKAPLIKWPLSRRTREKSFGHGLISVARARAKRGQHSSVSSKPLRNALSSSNIKIDTSPIEANKPKESQEDTYQEIDLKATSASVPTTPSRSYATQVSAIKKEAKKRRLSSLISRFQSLRMHNPHNSLEQRDSVPSPEKTRFSPNFESFDDDPFTSPDSEEEADLSAISPGAVSIGQKGVISANQTRDPFNKNLQDLRKQFKKQHSKDKTMTLSMKTMAAEGFLASSSQHDSSVSLIGPPQRSDKQRSPINMVRYWGSKF
ncbi:hypothetical protein Ciccas_002736 [Cichlidogyrus casuarinus]|uniref:Rab-GAP TBC domain-containing protein n=1 Tax=Cichlidogyrus casuarinus TaxID=1844966 RepID=A0ABD2QGT7_9PLAT